jgi:poly(3-hydroxybutyrate) depolymerase
MAGAPSGGSAGGGMPSGGRSNGGAPQAGTGSGTAGAGSGTGGSGQAGSGGGGGAMQSTGCGKAAGLSSGTASIDVSGTMRDYTLTIPDDYDSSKPYRLIFGLHWLGGSMGDVVSGSIIGGPYYGLESRSEGSAILVAPDGIDNGWANTGGRDVAFVKALVARLEENLCIDQSRIFSTGFSYGGIFSLVLACEMSDVFRAIAPESGMFFSDCTASSGRPVAVWQAQGASDTTVAPDRAKAANDYFVARNHCGTETMPVSPSPCVEYQGCDPGYPVIWCEFSGGHTPWNMAPDPVWDFFSQF